MVTNACVTITNSKQKECAEDKKFVAFVERIDEDKECCCVCCVRAYFVTEKMIGKINNDVDCEESSQQFCEKCPVESNK